jgi:hypothetical protein
MKIFRFAAAVILPLAFSMTSCVDNDVDNPPPT